MRKTKLTQFGFTMVELLVVMVILGLIMGVVGPKVLGSLGKAKVNTANIQIKDLEQTLELYMLDVGHYPSSSEGLEALNSKPNNAVGWNGPYLKKDVPLDPWKRPYHYQYPGENMEVDIYSLGKDGQQGGTGEDEDANNWGP